QVYCCLHYRIYQFQDPLLLFCCKLRSIVAFVTESTNFKTHFCCFAANSGLLLPSLPNLPISRPTSAVLLQTQVYCCLRHRIYQFQDPLLLFCCKLRSIVAFITESTNFKTHFCCFAANSGLLLPSSPNLPISRPTSAVLLQTQVYCCLHYRIYQFQDPLLLFCCKLRSIVAFITESTNFKTHFCCFAANSGLLLPSLPNLPI